MRIARAARAMLEDTILPFWLRLRDDEYGGFYGYMGYDLAVDKTAGKGCILNSRILWFFSEAALATGRADAAAAADHAYRFLCEHCLDKENGGVFWSVTHDGKPFDTTKHTYNQAFAIYALAAYHRLRGSVEALALAGELFKTVEQHCTDAGGYLEAFTVDWQPASNEKLSENGVMATRTMNTLLHVFEGYAGLYQTATCDAVEKALRRILDLYANQVFDQGRKRQRVFFDADYHSLIDLTSYGHDIESSWLIDWGTQLLGDSALTAKIGAINSQLAAAVYARAFKQSSILNECERGVNDEHRIWWVQAEAVLGFVNAFAKTDDAKYQKAAAGLWHFICEKLVDKRPGSEWFWRLEPDLTPDTQKPIVEPWKCPYHNGRLCLELMRRDPDVEV